MAGQNTSHAVMAQRIEPHDSLDFFPTPPWATRALCEYLTQIDPNLPLKRAWDPACGEGHMTRPLSEYFELVYGSDIAAYGHGGVRDFLFPGDEPEFDWIITNPPFRLADQFAHTMIDRAREGCAVLVRTSFLEGMGRYEDLFSKRKPSAILQFTERVPMHKGRLDPRGVTATAYCWIVWRCRPHKPDSGSMPMFVWIPPCRKKLERAQDYESISPIPEPAESIDPDQNATGGVLIPLMVAEQSGELEAGAAATESASSARPPALLAPGEPASVEGACGHAPPEFLSEAAGKRPVPSMRVEAPPAPVQGPPEQQRDTTGVTVGGDESGTSAVLDLEEVGRRAALIAVAAGEGVSREALRDLVGIGFVHVTMTAIVVTEEGQAWLQFLGDGDAGGRTGEAVAALANGAETSGMDVTAGETATSFSSLNTFSGIGSARETSAMLHPGVVDGPTASLAGRDSGDSVERHATNSVPDRWEHGPQDEAPPCAQAVTAGETAAEPGHEFSSLNSSSPAPLDIPAFLPEATSRPLDRAAHDTGATLGARATSPARASSFYDLGYSGIVPDFLRSQSGKVA